MADDLLTGLQPGADFDGRGKTFTEEELRSIVRAVHRKFGIAQFDGARFAGVANFEGVSFESGSFTGAQFDGNAIFAGARFELTADFTGTAFAGLARLGRLQAGTLDLSGARFSAQADIMVEAECVKGDQARFDGTASLRVRRAMIFLGGTVFNAPASIAGIEPIAQLESLRGSDVGNLTIIDVDLRRCMFDGAHRLDRLRIEGNCPLNTPPSWPWTRRAVLAEEYEHRWGVQHGGIDEARLAVLYRSLRKSFEDSKNEAGAGDFYYGEMEARRRSKETRRAERWILWLYWLISGYGQRAARALAALLALIATVTMLLFWWGQPFQDAAQIAVGAVVFRDDGKELTDAGEWAVMAARFLGPVLLALAVLAVRARVKR